MDIFVRCKASYLLTISKRHRKWRIAEPVTKRYQDRSPRKTAKFGLTVSYNLQEDISLITMAAVRECPFEHFNHYHNSSDLIIMRTSIVAMMTSYLLICFTYRKNRYFEHI